MLRHASGVYLIRGAVIITTYLAIDFLIQQWTRIIPEHQLIYWPKIPWRGISCWCLLMRQNTQWYALHESGLGLTLDSYLKGHDCSPNRGSDGSMSTPFIVLSVPTGTLMPFNNFRQYPGSCCWPGLDVVTNTLHLYLKWWQTWCLHLCIRVLRRFYCRFLGFMKHAKSCMYAWLSLTDMDISCNN